MASVAPLRKPVKCPACSAESKRDYYPFCSKRCSEKDLHHWFSDSYAIPIQEAEFETQE